MSRVLGAFCVLLSVVAAAPLRPNAASASAPPTLVCSTTEILGSDVAGNLFRINPITLGMTVEFTTSQTPFMNGLASNIDMGIAYWGFNQILYWYNPLTGLEGVLADLTGTVNGNLQSGGGAYFDGWYYFGVEDSTATAGLYRIQIDATGDGTSVVGGAVQLAADQPQDGLVAIASGALPDYGDMVVFANGLGQVIIEGSTAQRGGSTADLWTYNVSTGAFNVIASYASAFAFQMATLGGVTYGAENSTGIARGYTVDLATGATSLIGSYPVQIADYGGPFCAQVHAGQLSLTKSVLSTVDTDSSGDLTASDVITYQFVATNTGGAALGNVSIVDPLSGLGALSCSPSMPASLAAGAALTCSANYTVTSTDAVTGSISNTATALIGATEVDTASVSIPVSPALPTVTKAADTTGPVAAGDTITYTVTVDNPSGIALTDITVSDGLAPGTTYVAQSTVVIGFLPTPSAVSRNFPNPSSVPFGIASNPCSSPLVRSFNVLEDITITDVDLGVDISHTYRGDIQITLLSPTGTSVAITALTNDPDNGYDIRFDSASANPIDDGGADATDDAGYDRVAAPVASLGAFNGESGLGLWTLEICDGFNQDDGTVHFSELFIDGLVDVSLAATLDNLPAGANPDLTDGTPASLVVGADGFRLETGESMTVTYQVTVDTPDGSLASLDNTVTVNSTQQTSPVSATESLGLSFAPVLQINKTAVATASVGDTVNYTFAVSHSPTSDGSAVANIVVSDDLTAAPTYASGDDGDDLLEAGETWLYVASRAVTPTDPTPLVNTALVTGDDGDGNSLTATDSHSLNVTFAPQLQIVKNGPGTANAGDTVSYTFDVSHAPGSDLSPISGVVVTDDIAGAATLIGGDDGDGLLEAGETWQFSATYWILPGDPDPLVNIATASGVDGNGNAVADTDTHSLGVEFAPELVVVKSGPTDAAVGDTVGYGFAVSHGPGSDGSPVSGVGVVDDVAGAAVYGFGDDGDGLLESGETWTFLVNYTVIAASPDPLTNTGTASGTDRDGDPVSATDSHDLNVEYAPQILVVKTGPVAAAVGDIVTYTFAVSHAAGSDGSCRWF